MNEPGEIIKTTITKNKITETVIPITPQEKQEIMKAHGTYLEDGTQDSKEKLQERLRKLNAQEIIENKRSEILNFLQKKYLFYCDILNKNLTLYVWHNNYIWKNIVEAVILKEFVDICGTEKPAITLKSCLEHFQGYGQRTLIEDRPPTLIPFQNCLFDLETDQLLPHTPKYFNVNIIPHNYNPEAVCPQWEKFIFEIHLPQDIAFIQEWWGYNLYTSYPVKALMILIGNADNGKTVELDTMKHVLGKDNFTPITLQQLTYDETDPAELYHNIANICDELPSNKIKNVERVNNACSGGTISAQRKFGHPFQFDNIAKITYASNEPPDIIQDLDAFWNRLRSVDCPFVFKKDPALSKGERQAIDKEELEKTLFAEAEGILNWMIEGLKRLRSNNWRFSYSKSVEQGRQYYRVKANPVLCWIEKCFEYTGDEIDAVTREGTVQAFKAWCKSENLKKIPTRSQFLKTMTDEGFTAVQSRAHDMKRVYKGYRCNSVTAKKTILDYR